MLKEIFFLIFVLFSNWKISTGSSLINEFSLVENDDDNSTRVEKSFRHSHSSSEEVFDVTIVKELDCPYSYRKVGRLCLAYQYCVSANEITTYASAQAYCQSLGPGGGDLVVFHSADEYLAIVQFILQNDPGYLCSYWLGATYAAGVFTFVDNTFLPGTGPFWQTVQPTATPSPNVIFSNTDFYRLSSVVAAGGAAGGDTPSSTNVAAAICQFNPANITITQRFYPQKTPNYIPIPVPVKIGGHEHKGPPSGSGGAGNSGGAGGSSVSNLSIDLPSSNYSSEQNANFQNTPVINIETHSHYIDSAPEIIPIPSYLPPPQLIPSHGHHHHHKGGMKPEQPFYMGGMNPEHPFYMGDSNPNPYFPQRLDSDGGNTIPTIKGQSGNSANIPYVYTNHRQAPADLTNNPNQGAANVASRDDNSKIGSEKLDSNNSIGQVQNSESISEKNKNTLNTDLDRFQSRSKLTALRVGEVDSEDVLSQLTSLQDKTDKENSFYNTQRRSAVSLSSALPSNHESSHYPQPNIPESWHFAQQKKTGISTPANPSLYPVKPSDLASQFIPRLDSFGGYIPVIRGQSGYPANIPYIHSNRRLVPADFPNIYKQEAGKIASRDDNPLIGSGKFDVSKSIAQERNSEPISEGNKNTLLTDLERVQQNNNGNELKNIDKDSQNVMSQLTSILDKIDMEYGSSTASGQSEKELEPNQTRSDTVVETANLIKVMKELQTLILEIENLENSSTRNQERHQSKHSVINHKVKTPITSRRMLGSRLLDN